MLYIIKNNNDRSLISPQISLRNHSREIRHKNEGSMLNFTVFSDSY